MKKLQSDSLSYNPYAELHDICQKMNVRTGVIDIGPDIHAVRRFQTEEHFETFRCIYSDTQHRSPNFDHNDKIVRCNRNEMCDRVHGAFTGGSIIIPRGCFEVDEYCDQLTKMAKDTQRHPDTGIPKTRWIKTGNKQDHYFHATLYFLLACSQRSPVRDGFERKPIKRGSKFHL